MRAGLGSTSNRYRKLASFVPPAGRLVGKLPPALKSDPDAIKLAAACDERSWTIIRLINTRSFKVRPREGLRVLPCATIKRGLGSRSPQNPAGGLLPGL